MKLQLVVEITTAIEGKKSGHKKFVSEYRLPPGWRGLAFPEPRELRGSWVLRFHVVDAPRARRTVKEKK